MDEELKEILKDKQAAKEIKKLEIKLTTPVLTTKGVITPGEAKKAVKADENSQENNDVISRSFVANTYYWIDSHNDIHVDGCFTKSAKESLDKIFHLRDHVYQVGGKVGEPTAVSEKTITWRSVGVDRDGVTTALVMSSDIYKDYNKSTHAQYNNNKIDQHSIGFYYVKLDLAINDPEEEDEYKVWVEFFNKLGNPEKALEKGYFWVCREGKLKEVSCVLEGSNELTGMLDEEKTDDQEKVITETVKPKEKNDNTGSLLQYY